MTQQATLGPAGGHETTCTLKTVLEAEIAAAREDVERLAAMLGETRRVHKQHRERLDRFRKGLQQLEAEDAELATKETVQLRLLTKRREILYDLETEAAS